MGEIGDFEAAWKTSLDGLEKEGRLRALRTVPGDAVDFSSNDYLGLSQHPALIERAQHYAAQYGVGSGASRLVSGNLEPYQRIEKRIAKAKGAEAALVMVSGYQANSSVLPTLLDSHVLGGEPLVFADRLIHASLYQGCFAAGITPIRFRHNDLHHLGELLDRHARDNRPKMIVTETVFSMDGDCVDLHGLTRLADHHKAFLYLDEAHATGMFGRHGFGLACGVGGPRTLVMGTFGKALGSFGAYVACSQALHGYLVNRCPGLIYATALPPPVLGAIEAVFDLVPLMDAEREAALGHAAQFRDAMKQAGLDTGKSSTQIVPVILGAETRAVKIAQELERAGFLAVAIRPPTVPPGTSRIRFTFSARHTDEQVTHLIEAVVRLIKENP